ncbi:MAG: hypothetical protein GY798_21335 [Hyphomicrobiales bacterium]|nr:hypothetical protein [Hyphomicrobiales bacterium]
MFGFVKEAKDVRKIQQELQESFGAHGINFMQLHPTIHNVILRETLSIGNPDISVEKFFIISETIQDMEDKEGELVRLMLEYYSALKDKMIYQSDDSRHIGHAE